MDPLTTLKPRTLKNHAFQERKQAQNRGHFVSLCAFLVGTFCCTKQD